MTDLAGKRKEQILAAAKKCFLRKGFYETGMADIAREFGMSAGHIYNYFPSKSCIIEEIFKRSIDDFHRTMPRLVRSRDVSEIESVLKEFFFERPDKQQICLYLELLTDAVHNARMREMLERIDVDTRTHILRTVLGESAGKDEEACLKIDLMVATFEGLGLRMLRNPNFDPDALCAIFARRIHGLLQSFPRG